MMIHGRSMSVRRWGACAARLTVATIALCAATAIPASAMEFRPFAFDDGSAGIAAVGRITSDAPQGFLRSLQAVGSRPVTVFLDSPGGDVADSIELGQLFRQTGVSAKVARVGVNGQTGGGCYSACVYALMGARRRAVPAYSQVGIHRMIATQELTGAVSESTSPELRADHATMRSILARYASRMGVDPGLIFSAERTASTSLHVLSQAEIRRWRLAGPRL